MIKLLHQGNYKIVETRGETRLLVLDDQDFYAWIDAKVIGEILVLTKKRFGGQYTLVRGRFRLYEIRNEDTLTDAQHLELYIGEGFWQGYLLPTGLPAGKNIRNKIIPTTELITETSQLRLLH